MREQCEGINKQSRPANQNVIARHEAIQARASLAPCPTNLTLIFCLQAKNLIMSPLIISFACKYHFATCQQNIIFKLCYRKPWIASSPLLLAKTVGIRGIAIVKPGLLRYFVPRKDGRDKRHCYRKPWIASSPLLLAKTL